MNGYLKPRTIQIIGIVVFVAAAIFWAITDKESAVMLSFATSLIGVGAYSSTVEKISSVLEKRRSEPTAVRIVSDEREYES
jgi:hypothetical protein